MMGDAQKEAQKERPAPGAGLALTFDIPGR